jgi:mono/diheme cytochrome c family protein
VWSAGSTPEQKFFHYRSATADGKSHWRDERAPVFEGAKIFRAKGCLNCHLISGNGGRRGPDLTYIGDTLSESDIIIRIVNGGVNVPAFGNSLKPEELAQLTAFLQSRKHPSACWVGNDPALRNRTLAYS